jgi:hypothetical protein
MLSYKEKILLKNEINFLLKEKYDMEYYKVLFDMFRSCNIEDKIIKKIIKIEKAELIKDKLILSTKNYKIIFSTINGFSFWFQDIKNSYSENLILFLEILQKEINFENKNSQLFLKKLELLVQINIIASLIYLIYLKIHNIHIKEFNMNIWRELI